MASSKVAVSKKAAVSKEEVVLVTSHVSVMPYNNYVTEICNIPYGSFPLAQV